MITHEMLISGSYPTKPLGEVVEFLDSKRRPVTAVDRGSGPYPYYGANGQLGTIDGYLFDEPLVLLAEDGGHFDEPWRGVAYRVSGRSWVNNHAHVLRALPEVDHRFLARVLQNYDVMPFITGSTRHKLTKASSARIPIPVPPLKEQRRIAEVLDRADALRAKRREALAHLDDLPQSIFLDMFGDPVSNPRQWKDDVQLGNVTEIVSGITKGRRPSGPTTEVPYLAVANVQDQKLDLQAVKTIDATVAEISRYRLSDGDLLLTEGGDPDKLGRGTIWENQLPECIHQNHVFRIRVKDPDISPLYLSRLIGSRRGKDYFLRSAKQTTGIASINMSQLRRFPLLVPPLPLQDEFARRVEAVERVKERQRAHLAELDDLFESLQQRAFRGDL